MTAKPGIDPDLNIDLDLEIDLSDLETAECGGCCGTRVIRDASTGSSGSCPRCGGTGVESVGAPREDRDRRRLAADRVVEVEAGSVCLAVDRDPHPARVVGAWSAVVACLRGALRRVQNGWDPRSQR